MNLYRKVREGLIILGFPDIAWLCSALKVILHRQGIPFVVAPFSSHAQVWISNPHTSIVLKSFSWSTILMKEL